MLEVGCGEDGGVTPALAAAGYEPLGVDPRAPEGPLFRRTTLEELEDGDRFDAVVCGRVLHHIRPLEPALDKLARLAPLLVVDEFTVDAVDDAARDWYEGQHRLLTAAGRSPKGPPDLVAWRERHPALHTISTLRPALLERYDELVFEPRPYLYRWLEGPASEALEESLVAAGALRPIGWRWAGRVRQA